MPNAYTKGVPVHDFGYNFSDWEWGDPAKDVLKKMHEETAVLVASQIFDTMTLNIEVSGERIGQAVISTDAVEEAFFAFDLTEAVAGAVSRVETNYHPDWRQENQAATKTHLLALRAKLSALVDIVDASQVLKGEG
jgi:hypothetical protein